MSFHCPPAGFTSLLTLTGCPKWKEQEAQGSVVWQHCSEFPGLSISVGPPWGSARAPILRLCGSHMALRDMLHSLQALHLGADPQRPLRLSVILRCLIVYRDQFYQVKQGFQLINPSLSLRFNAMGTVAMGSSLIPRLLPSFTYQEVVRTHSNREMPQELVALKEP